MSTQRRRTMLAGFLAVFVAAVVWAADGPLTPLMQLRGRTDANGYLMVASGAVTGADGPLTPLANLRGRTDANGYVRVALSGSSIATFGDGTACTTPSIAFAAETTTGFLRPATGHVAMDAAGTCAFSMTGSGIYVKNDSFIGFGNSGNTATGSADTVLQRDAANVLAQKNGASAQEFRVYGTTTGPKYLSVSHNGTNGVIDTAASSGLLSIAPTNATGVQIGKPMSLLSAAVSVANVGANSCGTSAATIAGSNNAFVITVGATGGTQCRVTFTVAAATEWNCTVTDATTTIATRATPVSTTTTDFFGAFVAGDKVTGICFAR